MKQEELDGDDDVLVFTDFFLKILRVNDPTSGTVDERGR